MQSPAPGGEHQLESSLTEKALGVLVDTELNVRQPHACAAKMADGALGCGVRYRQKAKRGLPLHPALVGPQQECCVHFCLFPPQNLAFSLVPLTVLRDNETQQDCGGPCTDMAFVYLPGLYRCDKLHRFVSRGWKGKVKQSSVGFCSSLLFLFLIT